MLADVPVPAPVGADPCVVVSACREAAPLKLSPLQWRTLGYGVLIVGAWYGFAQWQQRQSTENQATIHRAEQALALGRSFRVRQAALIKRAETALAAAQAKDRVIQALRGQLQHAQTPRDTIRIQVILVDSLTAQRDSLTLAEAFQRARAERAEARVTLLETNLGATLKIAQCKILGVSWFPNCPSRNLSTVLGFGTGALAVLVLHR